VRRPLSWIASCLADSETHTDFINSNKELVPAGNAIDFLSDDGGETYNKCHFWSNFEIGDLDFWRGEAYMKFFEYLDEQGGFYYERWGDAPVHSIGAALFAKKEQIHFFEDIGYRHEPFQVSAGVLAAARVRLNRDTALPAGQLSQKGKVLVC
jgi:hypothetical protein